MDIYYKPALLTHKKAQAERESVIIIRKEEKEKESLG